VQLECYDCCFIGNVSEFSNEEALDLVEFFDQQSKSLTCPDCGGQNLGPIDE
jgi:hypothetical protein